MILFNGTLATLCAHKVLDFSISVMVPLKGVVDHKLMDPFSHTGIRLFRARLITDIDMLGNNLYPHPFSYFQKLGNRCACMAL